MTMLQCWYVAAAGTLAVGVGEVQASYILTPVSGGASTLEVTAGESFDLDVMLASDAGDVHNSAIFRVVFSEPGLVYESYSWSSPYDTGSIFDDSAPFIDDVAVVLDALTLSGIGYPDGVVDVELSNVVAGGGVFGEGLLASLTLSVPRDFATGSFFISLMPDTIANGFDEIETTSRSAFELIVVPGPGGLAVITAGCACRVSRRKRDVARCGCGDDCAS